MIKTLLGLSLVLAFAAHGAQGLDIVETARRLNLYSFVISLEEAQLTGAIKAAKNITVFVPTNQAFANLPDSFRAIWRSNLTTYQNALKYHVLGGKFFAANLTDEGIYPTLYDGFLGRFNIYNHTNKDNTLTFMGSVVNTTDLQADNGIIHLVNSVVTTVQPNSNLLELVAKDPQLTILANLTSYVPNFQKDVLTNTSHAFTLFAPNDEAFKKLPNGMVDTLRGNPVLLQQYLDYHVAPRGTYFSTGIQNAELIPTYNSTEKDVAWNKTVTVNILADGNVLINDAQIIAANGATSNGVFHVINTVLSPV